MTLTDYSIRKEIRAKYDDLKMLKMLDKIRNAFVWRVAPCQEKFEFAAIAVLSGEATLQEVIATIDEKGYDWYWINV